MSHVHDWRITDGGFAPRYFMGRQTKGLMVCKTAGIACLTCPATRRVPFEKAALLPLAGWNAPGPVWVQVWPIDGGRPEMVNARAA